MNRNCIWFIFCVCACFARGVVQVLCFACWPYIISVSFGLEGLGRRDMLRGSEELIK